MRDFVIYSLEIALCLSLFYTAYWLFLRNETFFGLNRFYLLFTVVLALLIPLLNFTPGGMGQNSALSKYLIQPIEQYEQKISMSIFSKSGLAKNAFMDAEGSNFSKNDNALNKKVGTMNPAMNDGLNTIQVLNNQSQFGWMSIALLIYFIGVTFFLLRFLANFIWIFAYVLKHKVQSLSGIKIIRMDKNLSPFSFLNYVFISQKNYPDSELNNIISHERIHIQQKHSLDLIFFELLLIVQWFNPFVWFYKRAAKINHEYLADIGTLNSGIELPDYQYSLLNQVLSENNFNIASNYNLAIKKRITMMMKKRSSRLASLKLMLILPLFIFLFSAFAIKPSKFKQDDLQNAGSSFMKKDSGIKKVNVPASYLKTLEGEYISTNEPRRTRTIMISEVLGTLFGTDNGYTYRLIPVGEGKFINPDDGVALVFNSSDPNAISFTLAGHINLNRVKTEKGGFAKRSMAFSMVHVIEKNGIAAALAHYKATKDSTNYFISENEMNLAGYELLNAGQAKEAAALFKLNLERNPNSFNVYDSYAESILALGDKKGAIENYKKSLQLNPGSKSGLKHLKDLGINTDELIKPVKVSKEYLELLAGDYLSTNQPNAMRWIRFEVEGNVLSGYDNGYHYTLIAMGDGKFINPDDGASLIFNTKDKKAISLLLFGEINLKKVKSATQVPANLKDLAGTYLPAKQDTMLRPMDIISNNNKLYRYIEQDPVPANRTVELIFVTDNIVYYSDRSSRSVEFIMNDKKEVTGCILRRWDGIFTLSKKK